MDQIANIIPNNSERKPISPRYFQSTEMLNTQMTDHLSSQPLRKTFSITNLNNQEHIGKSDCNVCKRRADIVSFYMKMREDLELTVESQKSEISMLQAKINMLQTNIATESNNKHAQLEQKLMDAELELAKIKANKQKILINHDHQLEDINKENMSLRNEIWQIKSDFNIQIANLKNELMTAQASTMSKENEYKIIISGLKNNINALEKELNMMQLQLMDSSAQIEKHEAVNEVLRSQIESLTTNNDNLTQILANKLETESIQATSHYAEIPQKSEAFLEMMQTDLNMNNGQTFTTRFLKLLKKYVRTKKTSKSTRLNGSLNNQKRLPSLTQK